MSQPEYLLLEDGESHLLLEDGSGALLLEDAMAFTDGNIHHMGDVELSHPCQLRGALRATSRREVHSLSGAVSTTTLDIPAGVRLEGVSFNVQGAVGDTWNANFTPGTSIVAGVSGDKNTKADRVLCEITLSTTNIEFTPGSGSFSGGEIEVMVYYYELVSLADV